jgi:hypothetical protein
MTEVHSAWNLKWRKICEKRRITTTDIFNNKINKATHAA